MAWWIRPMEVADLTGIGTGRWRLTANSDEGGGGPYGDETHDHETPEVATACEVCQAYCGRVSGFPPGPKREAEGESLAETMARFYADAAPEMRAYLRGDGPKPDGA